MTMIKTYEIEFDDKLVCEASKLFEELGTNIDTAINIFLKQALLRKGFPFEVAIPSDDEQAAISHNDTDKAEIAESSDTDKCGHDNSDSDLSESSHEGISDEEESAASVQTSSVSPDVAARVAANEALVAQMRNEIGDKNVVPEFDEGEEELVAGSEQLAVSSEQLEVIGNNSESLNESESPEITDDSKNPDAVSESMNCPESSENSPQESEPSDESEEEDENTPDNLFDAWDVGEEEDIGCQ